MFLVAVHHPVKPEGKCDRPDFYLVDPQPNLDCIPKKSGRVKVTLTANPGPADDRAIHGVEQAKVVGFKPPDFSGLHPPIEIREMNDTRHVGFGEFDLTAMDKMRFLLHGKDDCTLKECLFGLTELLGCRSGK